MAETFDWLKPSLLWQADGLDFRQPDFFRPHLLGFHSDTFMEDFLAAAAAPRPTAFQRALAAPQRVCQPRLCHTAPSRFACCTLEPSSGIMGGLYFR